MSTSVYGKASAVAKRRQWGDGSLTQRADGRWQASLVVELPNGNKTRRYFYGRTQKEAKAKLDAARRDKATGTLVANSPTVAQFMTDWLAARRKPPKPLKPNTWNGYETKVRTYIIPALGKKRLDQLRPQHIEAMYDWLRDQGLAESTVRQTHAILARALKDAVRKGLVGRSPMDRVQPPGTDVNERPQFTLEEAATALRAAGDSARWWLAIFYGMRQGEVLGLRWEDVDLDGGTLSVVQTRQRDYGSNGVVMGSPKSKASKRTLPLAPQIAIRLQLHWENAGKPTTGLVFPNSKGNPRDSSRDYKDWRAFIAAANLPPIALHAARNTAASMMEAAGLPDRVVAQILGQSQVKTTHGYQRAELERVRRYLENVEATLELEP